MVQGAILNTHKLPMVVVGSGFLGTHLAEQLRHCAHQVSVIDRSCCDLADKDAVTAALKHVPAGASIFIPASKTRSSAVDLPLFDENYRIVHNVINALPASTRHIVYFSSVDVYGPDPVCPIDESTPLHPVDYYSMSKMVGEFLVQKEAQVRGIPWTIFRLPGIYGSGDAGKSVISRMTFAARGLGQIRLTGNPESERDFVWVKDVACLAECAAREQISGLFNLATGCSTTIGQVAALLAAQLGPNIKVVQEGEQAHQRAAKLRFDISKLRECFPGLHMTGLEAGVTAYVNTQVKEEQE